MGNLTLALKVGLSEGSSLAESLLELGLCSLDLLGLLLVALNDLLLDTAVVLVGAVLALSDVLLAMGLSLLHLLGDLGTLLLLSELVLR